MTRAVPEGLEGIIPHLVVEGGVEAIDFYQRAFDAEEVQRTPHDDGRLLHAHLRVFGCNVYLCDDFPEFYEGVPRSAKSLGNSPVTLHLFVDDAPAVVKRSADAGATVVQPAKEMFWGDVYGVVRDPFGHLWSFATRVRDMTPEEIAESMRRGGG